MIEHRWEAWARLEDGVTEACVGGGVLQLVTVCLSDDGAGEFSEELELAELADRRSEEMQR